MTLPPKIITVLDLLKETKLKIPTYQRPYKWTIKNVNQLIDDILIHKGKSAYRIGTVVMHYDKAKEELNIVDGQQRSLTLVLIAYAISEHCPELLKKNKVLSQIDFKNLSLLKLEFNNDITLHNIQRNYNEIVRRIRNFDTDSINFFFGKCELVQIVLAEVSEAFQFFDSQNARGKDLEPHDLLKAYHLREMNNETERQMVESVAVWEDMKSKELAWLFENYLFRIRNWSKGRRARYFTKNEVDVFKGISFGSEPDYPYAKLYRMGHFYVDSYNGDYHRNIDMQKARFPFQIDQVIINGRRFFEMVSYYKAMIDKIDLKNGDKFLYLIRDESNNAFAKEIINTMNSYEGRYRTGDGYVRTLFDCALIYYMDKFGEENLSSTIEKFFMWAYRLRLDLHAVQLASMDNFAIENNIFRVMKESLHPKKIMNYELQIVEKNNSTKTTEIEQLFKRANYVR